MRLVAAAICVALTACATPSPQPQFRWVKAGATSSDFDTDHGYCQAQAFGPGNVSLLQAAIILNGCLRGKGWRQVPIQ